MRKRYLRLHHTLTGWGKGDLGENDNVNKKCGVRLDAISDSRKRTKVRSRVGSIIA
jgi:hypothetical protein